MHSAALISPPTPPPYMPQDKLTASQLHLIPSSLIQRMSSEIIAADLPWKTSYREHQSGDWSTVALMNPSGSSSDDILRDGLACGTEVLELLPQTQIFLKELGLQYMWVRIARLGANAYLWEHVDYLELEQKPRVRLHVPLITNQNAFISLPDVNIHMARGFLWKLDPRNRHGAANLGSRDRIHLIMDCYVDAKLGVWLQRESLDPRFVVQKKPLATNPVQFAHMIKLGHHQAAADFILKSFHRFCFGEETSYDLVANLYADDAEKVVKWKKLKDFYIYGGIKE